MNNIKYKLNKVDVDVFANGNAANGSLDELAKAYKEWSDNDYQKTLGDYKVAVTLEKITPEGDTTGNQEGGTTVQ